jgi:hypothetical protein
MTEKTTMEKKDNNEIQYKKELTTLAVKSALEKKNYKKLAGLVELADEYSVDGRLRTRAWSAVAQYWYELGHNAESVVAFNSARVLNPKNGKIIKSFFVALDAFLSEYREKFSSSDLDPLKEQINRLLEYYKVLKLWDSPSVEVGKKVLRKITYFIAQTAPAVETPATHKTEHIVKALRSNVSFEEVKADYARILAPIFRELMAKEIDEEKPKKKKKRDRKLPTEGPDKDVTSN